MHPHRLTHPSHAEKTALVGLFRDSFNASEGADEGQALGALVHDILARCLPDQALAYQTPGPAGPRAAVLFTPLDYGADAPKVMLLSPMAVATPDQRQGLGQALLAMALPDLRVQGVDVVLTYGDPAFYGKSGFVPADPATLPAPYPLSMPQGWLWQALDGSGPRPLAGPSHCVAALHDPGLW